MNEFEDRMQALRNRFAASTIEHADRLEELLQAGDLSGIRSLAHGLAGRSGMFGFDELGKTALAADEADDRSLSGAAWELIGELRRVGQER